MKTDTIDRRISGQSEAIRRKVLTSRRQKVQGVAKIVDITMTIIVCLSAVSVAYAFALQDRSEIFAACVSFALALSAKVWASLATGVTSLLCDIHDAQTRSRAA